MLRDNTHIENISFIMDYVSPVDLQLLAESLAFNERLKNIVLGKFSISNSSMRELVRGLAANRMKPV